LLISAFPEVGVYRFLYDSNFFAPGRKGEIAAGKQAQRKTAAVDGGIRGIPIDTPEPCRRMKTPGKRDQIRA
jgi:hypothetical protein